MSDIGGELDSMRATAKRFDSAGQTFSGRLNDLSTRMSTAARQFVETADAALKDATELTSQVDTEMTGLRSQGDATAWRGQNKVRFDADLAAFHAKINEATGKMREFVTSVKTQVAGPLNTEITTFGGEVRTSGASAQTIASSFNTSVIGQAEALDTAMNQGWSSGN